LDRELGWQSLSMQPEMTNTENPSLWSEMIIGT
jgi:hypothetical protein